MKIVTGLAVGLLIAVIVFGFVVDSGGNASEIEAMARLEMVRGDNAVNLTYARGDVFNQQVILLALFGCSGFGLFGLMLLALVVIAGLPSKAGIGTAVTHYHDQSTVVGHTDWGQG